MSHSIEPHHRDRQRGENDLGFDLPGPAKVSRTKVGVALVVGVGVVVSAFLLGWLPKRHAKQELEATTTEATSIARVDVVLPKVLASDRSMVLPGSIRPFEEATIRTRANGYILARHVDIGDKVEAGALLVDIDTPELDRQLEQARAGTAQATAALVNAKATRDYAKASYQRYEKLAPSGVTSQDELDKIRSGADVAEAGVAVAEANLEAQNANVRRLSQEKSFARVVAPFAGTIISRSVDKGALVNPTVELFKLATVHPMRVFVEVPQDAAPSIHADVPAIVTVREFAGRTFDGKIARFAGALDSQSRTMTTDIRVENPNGELLSGMYARVEITLPRPHRVLEIPSTALLTDAHGTRVAIVGPDKRIHLTPVTIERDTGPSIQIATGISETDRIVKIASADLVDGREVDAVTSK